MKNTAFVLLHYGDFSMTRNCLASFGRLIGDVYLVLNGEISPDDEKSAAAFPVGKTVRIGKNAGFAGGMNGGIREAVKDGYGRVMILNNDVLLEEDFPEKLDVIIKKTENEKVCFSPLILDGRGETVWFSGAVLSLWTGRAKHLDMGTGKIPADARESDYLTGCAFCVPSKGIEEAGVLDEKYFLYWEDTDWSIRLRDKGYRLLVYPELRIRHLGSASTKLESGNYLYYYTRNQLRFLFSHCPCFLLPVTMMFFVLNLARMFAGWALFHGKEGREKAGSVLAGIRGFILSQEGERRAG